MYKSHSNMVTLTTRNKFCLIASAKASLTNTEKLVVYVCKTCVFTKRLGIWKNGTGISNEKWHNNRADVTPSQAKYEELYTQIANKIYARKRLRRNCNCRTHIGPTQNEKKQITQYMVIHYKGQLQAIKLQQ